MSRSRRVLSTEAKGCFVFFPLLFKMCTVGLYVSLCLMIFLCPFLHCKALRTAMYKRYINSIIIIIINSLRMTFPELRANRC